MSAKFSGSVMLWLAGVVAGFVMMGTLAGWLPFDGFEVFGIVTGTACVVLAIRQNVWNFPLGMVNNVCFAVLFFNNRLYGIAAVQVVYFVLGAHGWYRWQRGVGDGPLRISRMSRRETMLLTLIGVPVMWALTGYLHSTGDALALPDAVTTVLSLSAQYMLNLKRAENWAIGVVADVIYVAINLSQGLYLSAGLYSFYLVMCVQGYREWLAIYREQVASSLVLSIEEPSETAASL